MGDSPYRILIAEDNKADVYLIEEALRRYGVAYQLETVDNGEDMLRMIAKIDQDPAHQLGRDPEKVRQRDAQLLALQAEKERSGGHKQPSEATRTMLRYLGQRRGLEEICRGLYDRYPQPGKELSNLTENCQRWR